MWWNNVKADPIRKSIRFCDRKFSSITKGDHICNWMNASSFWSNTTLSWMVLHHSNNAIVLYGFSPANRNYHKTSLNWNAAAFIPYFWFNVNCIYSNCIARPYIACGSFNDMISDENINLELLYCQHTTIYVWFVRLMVLALCFTCLESEQYLMLLPSQSYPTINNNYYSLCDFLRNKPKYQDRSVSSEIRVKWRKIALNRRWYFKR